MAISCPCSVCTLHISVVGVVTLDDSNALVQARSRRRRPPPPRPPRPPRTRPRRSRRSNPCSTQRWRHAPKKLRNNHLHFPYIHHLRLPFVHTAQQLHKLLQLVRAAPPAVASRSGLWRTPEESLDAPLRTGGRRRERSCSTKFSSARALCSTAATIRC